MASMSRVEDIKRRVFEILVRKPGQMLPAKAIIEAMGDTDLSPPQLSQFIRMYMLGEEHAEFLFVKTDEGYGLLSKRTSLEDDQRDFWLRR